MIRSLVAQKGVLMVSVNNNIIYNDMAIFNELAFSLADLCQIYISHREQKTKQNNNNNNNNNIQSVFHLLIMLQAIAS